VTSTDQSGINFIEQARSLDRLLSLIYLKKTPLPTKAMLFSFCPVQ
jgi:hypothetical protein